MVNNEERKRSSESAQHTTFFKVGLTLLGLLLTASLIVGLILIARSLKPRKQKNQNFFLLFNRENSQLQHDSIDRYMTRTRGEYYTQVITIYKVLN